jgi:hypothetical protein
MPASKNPIPELKDYGIDKYTGFMPNPPPVKRLNDYYSLWENMMDNLPSLIMTGSLRQWITKVPLSNYSFHCWIWNIWFLYKNKEGPIQFWYSWHMDIFMV